MMTIGFLEPGDITDIAAIEKECFSTPWSAQTIRGELDSHNSVVFVARDGGRAVGYVIMNSVCCEASIFRVAVADDYRRRGVASALFGALDKYAFDNSLDYVTLEVRAGNAPAIALYEKFGFRRFSLRRRFYTDPTEDGVIYTKYYKENFNRENTGN